MSAPEAAVAVAPVEEVKPVEATPTPAVEAEAPKVEEVPAPVRLSFSFSLPPVALTFVLFYFYLFNNNQAVEAPAPAVEAEAPAAPAVEADTAPVVEEAKEESKPVRNFLTQPYFFCLSVARLSLKPKRRRAQRAPACSLSSLPRSKMARQRVRRK